MATKLIDLYNHLIKYNNDVVFIAFHSKTQEPYFHAKQLCELLKYTRYKEALKNNITNKKDIDYIKNIVSNYKTLYKNIQGHTKFITEAGLYSLIMSSRKKEAIDIRNWITHEVMPSIRKHGEYKLNSNLKKEIDQLNKTIDQQKNEIGVLKHNIKKPLLKKGKVVYILRTIETTVDLNIDEVLYVKFGRTKNMKGRKATYDTCTKNKVQILKTIEVDDAKNIEQCVLKKMENFRVNPKKEYFECTYNDIIVQLGACIKFYENKDIDNKPDVDYNNIKLSRQVDFNKDKILLVKFFDAKDNILCEQEDINSSDDSESEDEDVNDAEDIKQDGGGNTFYYDYIKYKIKYLELKFDLM
jgi:prophage antirepressor-like protein